VLYDDASLAYLRANGVGEIDATIHPAEWLDDLEGWAGALGAPVRRYHLRDVLDPKAWAPDAAAAVAEFAAIKLVIVPNAIALEDAAVAALGRFEAAANRTMVYYWAPGLLGRADTEVKFTGLTQALGQL
jgi:hypothetical protein